MLLLCVNVALCLQQKLKNDEIRKLKPQTKREIFENAVVDVVLLMDPAERKKREPPDPEGHPPAKKIAADIVLEDVDPKVIFGKIYYSCNLLLTQGGLRYNVIG